jgi:hypothetical protein
MKTHPKLMNPDRELWLRDQLPVFVVRFYRQYVTERDDETVDGLKFTAIEVKRQPMAEHVYKPTGMMNYTREHGKFYHYEYEKTRKV